MRSLVIDTDTASDDAVALVLAARTPGVVIRLVTTVAGNVPLPLATRNALVALELAGAGHVPVHPGCAAPMLRPLETAQFVHGEDGMAGVPLPDPAAGPVAPGAVEALVQVARDEPGRHVLVTLGPLTNVAAALLVEPALLTMFQHTYCMAGAFDGVGNVHPVGEFNVWADPEAASIVMRAAGDITCIGWDVSRRYAVMRPAEQERLRSLGALGRFAVDINRCVDEFCREVTGLEGYDLPDPIAMAAAIDPALIVRQSAHHVTVGLDPLGRGGTFVDHRHGAPDPNVTVAWEVSEAGFKELLFAACTDT